LTAARALVAELGPAAVTVDAVARRLGAPKGSFYHRFASRDVLLGELWLETALAFQQDFLAAIDAGDGLRAALHTPVWVRAHSEEARLLMLHSRRDFVHGEWPEALRQGVADQERNFIERIAHFAREVFGGAERDDLRRALFVLVEVPLAAVKQHIVRGEPPPPVVDALIAETFRAIVAGAARARST
jgi:AcrR family transcriptional regulator